MTSNAIPIAQTINNPDAMLQDNNRRPVRATVKPAVFAKSTEPLYDRSPGKEYEEMNPMAESAEAETLDDRFNKERVRMHRQLYSAISHDLKTPLASTIGALEIYQRMKEKLSPEKQQALILTALQEAYRLDNFVTNILDMGKLENGMVSTHNETFDLGRCLKGCISNNESRLRGANVSIDAAVGDVSVVSDQSLLCRAIVLLLDNAIKYGGKPTAIKLVYGTDGANAFVTVNDNGQGVPEPQKETIFDKYTRFVKRDQQHAGTGLGLAICREIMTLLNGAVTLEESAQGSGAVFKLILPAKA